MNTVAWGAVSANAAWPYHSTRTRELLIARVGQQSGASQREAVGCAESRRQHLVDGDLAVFESLGGGEQVEPPGPFALLADQRRRLVAVGVEVGQPPAEGQRVVVAQRLHVA